MVQTLLPEKKKKNFFYCVEIIIFAKKFSYA